jgi:hypothetical protein
MSYTEGPWKQSVGVWVCGEDGTPVCYCDMTKEITEGEKQDNAALIALAPEMADVILRAADKGVIKSVWIDLRKLAARIPK